MKRSHLAYGVIGVVVAGLVYAHFSRFDRLANRATAATAPAEEWEILKEHPDDPRVIAAAAFELRDAAGLPDCDSVGRAALRAGAVLDAHPTTDDDSLAAIGKMIASCNDPRTTRWTTRPPEDLVKVLHKDLAHASAAPKNILPEALVRLAPRVTQELVDVVVATTKADGGMGETLVATGFPQNGEKLAAPSASVPRQLSKTDYRVSTAIRTWLGSLKDTGASEVDAKCIARALGWSGGTQLDDPMAEALAKSIDRGVEVQALCAKLVVLPNDAEVLKKHGSGANIDACAASALKLKEALDLLNATAAAATQFEDEKGEAAKQKRDAWEDAQAAIIAKLGVPAVAAAKEGMKSDARTTRRVSARTLAKVDRVTYFTTISERMHAKTANGDDAKLALELMTKEGAFDPAPVLAAFYIGDTDVVKRATNVLKTTKPDLWVAPLFADLSVETAGSPSVIFGYTAALSQTEGAAPLAATVLETALKRSGRAETMFWLTKYLALTALKAKGTAANAELVDKFTADKTTYPVIKLRSESLTGEMLEESRTTKPISELAATTLAAVKGR